MSIDWITTKTSGRGSKSLNAFLEKFVENIAICTGKYHRAFSDEFGYSHYPLLGNEREIYSLMSAAMHKLTPIHQSESGIIKRRDMRNPRNRNRERSKKGRVDLWSCKDGIEYFFEFKRSYVSSNTVNTGKIPKQVYEPWKNLIRQTKEVKSGVLKGFNYQNQAVYFIGLNIVTIFQSSKKEDTLSNPRQITDRQLRQWIASFDPSPSTVLRYITDEEMKINPIGWSKNGSQEKKWEFHPYHLFCFTIAG